MTILNQVFLVWEVAAITSIPVPHVGGEDKWEWHHTRNGEFMVRSAYYIAIKETNDMAALS